MPKQRLFGLIGVTSIVLLAALHFWVYKNTYLNKDSAFINCGQHIWMIDKDSPFYDVRQLDEVTERNTGQRPSDADSLLFTCHKEEADRVVRYENLLTASIYLLVPLWLPVLLLYAVGQWLVFEVRNK